MKIPFEHLKLEGEQIPWGWAVSFRDFERDVAVCHPIPFHLLRRWARDLRYWLMRVGRPGYRERAEHAIWRAGKQTTFRLLEEREAIGYEKGYRDGRIAGINAALVAIDQTIAAKSAQTPV